MPGTGTRSSERNCNLRDMAGPPCAREVERPGNSPRIDCKAQGKTKGRRARKRLQRGIDLVRDKDSLYLLRRRRGPSGVAHWGPGNGGALKGPRKIFPGKPGDDVGA